MTVRDLQGKKGGKGKGKTKGGKAKKPPGVDTRMKKDTRVRYSCYCWSQVNIVPATAQEKNV